MGQIRTIVVIGAGIMGRGIAHASALGGFRTILEDILPASLRRAEDEIRANLDESVTLGNLMKADADAALARLEFATSLEDAAREGDMVIEAVPEEFDSKEEIFRLLDRICRPGTVLASNTSSLSITEIAAVTERPVDVVGMHFINPVHEMRRIEIICGAKSRRMGKEPTLINEVGRKHTAAQ
jgi:3-hydroxybutyryl-CoA dehydrogenase